MADGAARVRKHRAKMKAAGLKPVTLWVPDVNSPTFKARFERACLAVNASEDSRIVLSGMEELAADLSDL